MFAVKHHFQITTNGRWNYTGSKNELQKTIVKTCIISEVAKQVTVVDAIEWLTWTVTQIAKCLKKCGFYPEKLGISNIYFRRGCLWSVTKHHFSNPIH